MTPELRPHLPLDGEWEFSFEGPTASLSAAQIRTPGIWQAQFPELRNAPGIGRYRRQIALPEAWRGRAVHLVMEGVFHETAISVDGRRVGEHGDGWTTIDLDLTEALAGKTSFTLEVEALLPDERGLGRASLGETFAAKQDWYGLQGGIWKPARLEAPAPTHFAELSLQTLDRRVRARGTLSSATQGAALQITLRRDGVEIARALRPIGAAFDCELDAPGVALWSPGSPSLYECECALLIGGEAVDALTRTLGFRRFEARDGRLFLNGEPFLMFGALDQDWHPQEECRAPSAEYLERRFRNAKAMGLNTLRCHVKIPDPLYFDLADRLGLVVWLDMPYCEYLTPSARVTLERVFDRSVATHAHHPSIFIWTLCNEGWGIDLDDNPDDRLWLKGFYERAKTAVPGSLVVDNSPCFPRNYHVKTDIEDFHWYNGFPHQTAEFQATAAKFAGHAEFAWSPHGDAVKRGDEPLICSEFGVWGLPHPRDLLENGREPWWFESGHDWNNGAAYPHGMATRFRDAGLAPVFGDLDRFVDAAQEHQYRGLKTQIEALRWEPAISGYVITELNDTLWEANGLMDAANNPRSFAERLKALQTPWLVLARTARTAVACGERFDVELRLAGPEPARGARIVWRFGEVSGEAAAGATISLTAPDCATPSLAHLELDAYAADGRWLSRNRFELCLVPPLREAPALTPVDNVAAALMDALRWPAAGGGTLLATQLTTPLRERLLEGRRALLIANNEEALKDPESRLTQSDRHNFPRMNLRKREGSSWDGRWMGAFAWRRTDGAWSALPGGPMLDEHWQGLTPHHVLTSYLSTAYTGLVDAGVAVAWLHASAAFVKRTRLGPGRLTVTTFDFSSFASVANPLAPHLLTACAAAE